MLRVSSFLFIFTAQSVIPLPNECEMILTVSSNRFSAHKMFNTTYYYTIPFPILKHVNFTFCAYTNDLF